MTAKGTVALQRTLLPFQMAYAPLGYRAEKPRAEPPIQKYAKQWRYRQRLQAQGRCVRCGDIASVPLRVCAACHALRGFGTNRHAARLTDAQVLDIRVRRAAGETLQALGKAFQTTPTNIHVITLGLTWRHVSGPIQIPKWWVA